MDVSLRRPSREEAATSGSHNHNHEVQFKAAGIRRRLDGGPPRVLVANDAELHYSCIRIISKSSTLGGAATQDIE